MGICLERAVSNFVYGMNNITIKKIHYILIINKVLIIKQFK